MMQAPLFLVAAVLTAAPYAVGQERPIRYHHPLGLTFQKPKAWRIQETALGLQLLPPDTKVGPAGPSELFVASVVGTDPRVRTIDDKRGLRQLDQRVRQLLPFVRSAGKPKKIGKHGRLFAWAGRYRGRDVACSVYGKLAGGYFLSISATGDPARIEQHRRTIEALFGTLALGEPKADRRLAGTWYSKGYRSVGRVGDRVNFASTRAVTLLPNGRLRSSGQTAISGSTGRNNPQRPGTSITGLTRSAVEEGRWALAGDKLYVLWRTAGATRFSIYVQGRRGRREMLLKTANGGKSLWTEYNN